MTDTYQHLTPPDARAWVDAVSDRIFAALGLTEPIVPGKQATVWCEGWYGFNPRVSLETPDFWLLLRWDPAPTILPCRGAQIAPPMVAHLGFPLRPPNRERGWRTLTRVNDSMDGAISKLLDDAEEALRPEEGARELCANFA